MDVSIDQKKLAKRASPTDVLDHWPQLIEGLQYSPQDFYAKIEQALVDRQVPNIRVERVDWPEGGFLSDHREYLRISRERLIFDVCGAPFGTGFFVSIWACEKRLRLGFLAGCFLLFVGVLAVNAVLLMLRDYQIVWLRWGIPPDSTNYMLLWILASIAIVMLVKVGPNPDAFLLGLPIVGYFYERYFRKITYYRIDRMCMYRQAVKAAVMQVIDEITVDKGIKPLSELGRRLVPDESFRRQGSDARI